MIENDETNMGLVDALDDIDLDITYRSTISKMTLTPKLFYKLFNAGIIEKNTTMVCLNDIGFKHAEYIVRDVNTSKATPYIQLQDVENMSAGKFWITPEKINLIGGMTIDDIFSAYEIRTDDLPELIEIHSQTDVEGAWQHKDIIRVEYQGELVEVKPGMKLKLFNDVNEKYNNRVALVKENDDGTISVVRGRGRPKTNFEKI